MVDEPCGLREADLPSNAAIQTMTLSIMMMMIIITIISILIIIIIIFILIIIIIIVIVIVTIILAKPMVTRSSITIIPRILNPGRFPDRRKAASDEPLTTLADASNHPQQKGMLNRIRCAGP